MVKKKKEVRIVEFDTGALVTNITISTRCPKKWLFVDRETGKVYKWSGKTGPCDNQFVKA